METKVKLMLESLEDRCCPSGSVFSDVASNVYEHGGTVLTNPDVTNVYFGSAPNMDAFTQVLVGDYSSELARWYGGGTGSLVASVNLGNGGPVTVVGVEDALTNAFDTGQLPQPENQSLYMVYLGNPETDLPGDGAYHDYFNYNNTQVPFTVCWGTTVASNTGGASHEFAEARTDPFGDGYYQDPSPNGGEICDLAAQFVTLDGYQIAAFVNHIAPPVGSTPQLPNDGELRADDLDVIPYEEFRALAFRVLAFVDLRDFAGEAAQAQEQLANNPMLYTPQGQFEALLGEAAFVRAVSSQP